MSPYAQILIAMVVIGLVIGGIAAIRAKGRGLITYLIVGVVGAFIGGLWLPPVVGVFSIDPLMSVLICAPIGAIILVVAAGLILKLLPHSN